MAITNTVRMPLLISALLVCGCRSETSQPGAGTSSSESRVTMKLESEAFANGDTIPDQFTTEGQDISPPLRWSEVPPETQAFAVICDDPDAPNPRSPGPEPWVHWVLFNIPAEVTELPAGIATEETPSDPAGARQGTNSWPSNNVGYRGPAPPPGSGVHRYFFKLYALDQPIDLVAGASKQQLLAAIDGHVLAEGQLVGTYER